MKVIGSMLKEKREKDGLTLEQVHKAIKVQEKYLIAIEEGDDKVFSAEVYYKSFLKSYAKYLGFDANMLVNQYEARKIPLNISSDKDENKKSEKADNGGKANFKKSAVTILIAGCLIAVFFYLNKNISNIVSDDYSAIEHKKQMPEQTLNNEMKSGGQAAVDVQTGPEVKPDIKLEAKQPVVQPVPVQTVKNEIKKNGQAAIDVQAKPEVKIEVKPVVQPQKQEPAVLQKQKLSIQAVSNVWIKVDGDNRGLYEGTLLKGEEKTWKADNVFNLRVGYTPGVKVFFNDEEVDVISGSVQDVNTIVFQRQ